jgi:hypothetical protein
MKELIKAKRLPENHVVFRALDFQGRVKGIYTQPYDGSIEDMVDQMMNLQNRIQFMYDDCSGINSQNFATDEKGELKWVISPNGRYVSEVGTADARYTLGDISAKV